MKTISPHALLTNLVYECVSQRLMFTAYNLTQTVRHSGEFLKHDDGRKIVHKMYDDGLMGRDYARTLVDLGGANGPCYVYHHHLDNPYRYTDHVKKPLPNAQAYTQQGRTPILQQTAVQWPSVNPINNVARRSQTERVAKSRHRISLPNAVVRQAGFVTGDLVYVGYNAQDRIYTYERQMPQPGLYDRVGLTRVDKSNNIRHRVGRAAALRFRISVSSLGYIQAEPVNSISSPPNLQQTV